MARRQARFGELLACQVTPSAILSGVEPEEAAA
jgi:hypothetical protein